MKNVARISDPKHGISRMLLLFILINVASTVGCASALTGTASDSFRKLMDREIGGDIKQSWVQKYEKHIIDMNDSEYIIRDRGSGCVVIFTVDETSGDIRAWRYVSDPSACKIARPP